MALAAAQRVDAIAAALVPTAATVTTDRFHPFAESELPAWRVTADAEDVTASGLDGTEEHILIVNAEGFVQADTGIDDAMNDLAADGLAAVATAHPNTYQLQGIDREASQSAEACTGVIRLRFATRFFVSPAAPEVIVS